MKKLATLEVFLDPEGTETSSSEHERGDNHYRIILRPKGDAKVAPQFAGQMANILAHELGHFVGDVTGSPLQANSGYWDSLPENNLKSEEEAWSLADKMIPGVKDSPIAKDALRAYTEVAEKTKGMPHGLAKILGYVS